ncbi:MAG TPA: hypothetical protein PKW71_12270, partial [Anaerohalosphaeraceae bacterium]|nr:hypothetical protein [Anaerohalosphaeraceae bacterium]
NNRTANRHDSNKLSIRGDASAAKSWIKWTDLDGINVSTIRQAQLRLTTYETRPGLFDVSAVNDDYTTNINWGERDITWDNAPANATESYTAVLAGAATYVGRMDFQNTVAGDQRFIDVTSILKADTDGIVQFILHNSTTLMNMCTHDQGGTMIDGTVIGPEAARPMLFITLPPAGADWPNPELNQVVSSTLSTLSWTNPEPNIPGTLITCEVFLGTEPNLLTMDRKPLTPGATSVAVNKTNFPTYGALANNTRYYWKVDCYDPSRVPALIPGEMWTFYVGQPPSVDAGQDQVVWLTDGSVTVNLDGTVTDDGPFTVVWTQLATGAPTVTISPDNVQDTSITLTARGTYEFMLTADDGTLQSSDTVRVVVGNTPCDASHLASGKPYNTADANQDCIVDLTDFAALIIQDWLECTDTLMLCAR